MLLTSYVGHPPGVISGLGAVASASEPLKKLQLALVALSDATHNTAIKPTNVTGTLTNGLPDDRTMVAVTASLGLISPHLPTWAAVGLSIAFGVGGATATAKKAVLDYADPLRVAVLAATATAPYYTKTPDTTSSDTKSDIPTIFQTTGPWYKTFWGIGAIAIGAIGAISLIAAHRRPST